MLVASEVVTQAVLHAGADIEFVVVADHPMVRLEVHEAGTSATGLSHPTDDRSYRLRLIEALCEGWGVEERGDWSRYTWFEIRS